MPAAEEPSPGRVRTGLSGTRGLVRIAYRDPEHLPERLTLYSTRQLGEDSGEWARRKLAEPGASPERLAETLRGHTAKVARIDGAIAGTPFFIALVPGYVAYLWEEARMGLRTAALFGRDPTSLETAAELLALRGSHPDIETAKAALIHARDNPAPSKPGGRRSLRLWYRTVYSILVFGGFLSASSGKPEGMRARLVAAGGFAVGGAIWAVTWIAPVTLMLALAWGCESHARSLGRRTLAHYGGEVPPRDEGREARQVVRSILLAFSLAVPIGFVAYANHVRNSTGVNWVAALGALVALAVVIAVSVSSRRR